jgi:MSHA biogenesis protein MshI
MECRVFGLFKKSAAAKGRIGVVFGKSQIAIAVITREGDTIHLKRCETLALATAEGAEALTATLRGAGLPRLPISAVLGAADYQLALVEAPEVPPAELRTAMRWRLKDAIDFPVADAVIDVFDVPSQNRGGHGRMMYAVAARRTAVDGYADALAGLSTFDVVDVPELCLRNLASSLPQAAGGVALLHLGETTASVVLVRGTTLYFARQMELRAAKNVAAPLNGVEHVDGQGIDLELQRSLDYYERHFDQPPITKIVVSPGGPRAQALAEVLNRDTGFEVTVVDLNSLFRCEVPVAPDTQAACMMAVGAALREERRSL